MLSVLSVKFISPWSERVSEIASAAAVNVETEQRVARLNEEMKDLIRELRSKDQSLQESTVKIELMDKRMETAKKQTDMMTDLEGELSKAKKDSKTYEQTIEDLQKELESLEQENVKLKNAATSAPAVEAKPSEQFCKGAPMSANVTPRWPTYGAVVLARRHSRRGRPGLYRFTRDGATTGLHRVSQVHTAVSSAGEYFPQISGSHV